MSHLWFKCSFNHHRWIKICYALTRVSVLVLWSLLAFYFLASKNEIRLPYLYIQLLYCLIFFISILLSSSSIWWPSSTGGLFCHFLGVRINCFDFKWLTVEIDYCFDFKWLTWNWLFSSSLSILPICICKRISANQFKAHLNKRGRLIHHYNKYDA